MPPFQIGVQIGTSWRQLYGLDSDSLQDPSERFTEFGISIVQQITAPVEEAHIRQADVSRHLCHPVFVGLDRDSDDAHGSGCQSHAGEHVVGRQSACRPHFSTEEVYRGKNL